MAKGGTKAADRAVGGLTGWRWKAMLTVLTLATLLDLGYVGSGGAAPLWLLFPVLFVAVAAVAAHGLRSGGSRLFTDASWAAALSVLGSAAIAPVAVVSNATAGFGFVEGVALTLLLVACWRHAAGRRQQLITGAVVLAVVLLPLRLGLFIDTATIEALAIMVAALAVATGSVLRAADASHDVAVTAVRRAEREEVARELHDVVAHHVTGMVVLTQAARTVAHSSSPFLFSAEESVSLATEQPSLDEALVAVEQAGAEALASLRSMVAVLRSVAADAPGGTPLEPTPRVEHLEEMVGRFRDSGAAARVDLRIAPAARALPPQLQAALHRVVQESLTNVSRYARGAQSVNIDLACADGHTMLTVSDSGGRAKDGPGAGDDAAWGGGFGIIGMRERVVALGGTLVAAPNTGPGAQGWTVRAQVHP